MWIRKRGPRLRQLSLGNMSSGRFIDSLCPQACLPNYNRGNTCDRNPSSTSGNSERSRRWRWLGRGTYNHRPVPFQWQGSNRDLDVHCLWDSYPTFHFILGLDEAPRVEIEDWNRLQHSQNCLSNFPRRQLFRRHIIYSLGWFVAHNNRCRDSWHHFDSDDL